MTDIDVAVNILGGDTNKVIYDEIGLPSIMVEISEKNFTFDGVAYGADIHHPAFIVNGTHRPKFYVSKYQNAVMHGRGYSMPMQVPHRNSNFDFAFNACKSKGFGWHLMTNAEWAYLAILGYLPHGNNNGGTDFRGEDRYGTRAELADRSLSDLILTGSGPVSFSHNGKASGIWDLNGNVPEWVSGLRLNAPEINIYPNNDAADFTNVESWRAILSTGELVPPGTTGSLKLGSSSSPIIITNSDYPTLMEDKTEQLFSSLSSYETDIPHIMKALAIAPWDGVEEGYISMKNIGIRPALRGGGSTDGIKAGIRALNFCYLADVSGFAFRSSYIDLLDSVLLADEDGTTLATENGMIITN